MLLHRRQGGGHEVLLVLPGGPFWARRDIGAWQMPKGEVEAGESAETAARREVEEELGVRLEGPLTPLGEIRQVGGKRVTGFALERDLDPGSITSNTFEIEWPPRSGKRQRFPEVAAARWLTFAQARAAMLPSQLPLLERLAARLG